MVSWAHLTARGQPGGCVPCTDPGVRVEVGRREGKDSYWGKLAITVTAPV